MLRFGSGRASARVLSALVAVLSSSAASAQTVVIEGARTADAVAAAPATGQPGSLFLDPVVIEGFSQIGGFGVSQGNTVAVVGREEVETFRPMTVQELFARETAITVGGTITSNQKIYVHGFEETNLAVSIDGSRQNNKVFHHNATTLIDPQLLKAVRVDAGVAPADAGPAALAGSIVYETVDVGDLLEPGEPLGGFIDAGYETNGATFSKRGAVYGQHNGFEVLGYLNGVDGDDYDDGAGREIVGSGASVLSGLGKIAYEVETGDRVELSYERVTDDAERPYRSNIGAVLGGRPVPETRNYDLDRQNAVISYENTLAAGLWDPRIVLAYSGTTLRTDETPLRGGDDIVYDAETESINGLAENDFNIDIGTVTAGVDFYDEEALFDGAGYRTSEKARNFGGYGQARIEPIERLALSFGGRVDHQEFTGTDGGDQSNSGVSGNVSGEFDLTEIFAVKAGYSNVWGGIALGENFIINPDWVYDDIETVRAENTFAGFVVRYEGIVLDAQVFDTQIENGRVPSFGGGPGMVSDFSSQGFDIALGYEWASGYVQAKYTNVDTEIDGEVADSFAGNYFTTPIGELITISAVHRFEGRGLTIGGSTEIALKENETEFSGRALEGYEVFNAFAEYRPAQFQNWSLRAEAKNIFDVDYAHRATYGQDFIDVRPLTQPGRSFGFSTRVTF